tara:strand:- start:774 stop:1025 length:252 start_codon:yes stop_codon:yes gene_type:complete
MKKQYHTGDLVKLKEPRACRIHAYCQCKPEEVMGIMVKPAGKDEWAEILWFEDGFVTANKNNYEMVRAKMYTKKIINDLQEAG